MTSAKVHTKEGEAPWEAIAHRKKAQQTSLIPSKWRIPESSSHLIPQEFSLSESRMDDKTIEKLRQNVLEIPRQFLSDQEISITESHNISSLLSAISSARLSTADVTLAFCHRASLAHELTNCLTEPLFETAIQRAKELDEYLRQHGEVFGPLHGLPVSVKDSFDVTGVDSSVGIAALCFKPAESNAPLVDLLLSLGCVIIAKTNVPQTLASLDSVNNVFGRTMNPINRLMTAGGSSGGEGVLVRMRGSMIGIGTDIGGSIRIPAMCNGIYGFKPSVGRLPFRGRPLISAEGISRASVEAVAGPIARSVEDIQVLMKEIVPRASLWGEDCVPGSWSTTSSPVWTSSGNSKEMVIGILRSDGNTLLLPPIAKIINEVAEKLKGTPGVRIVELETTKAWTRCQSVMSKLMGVEGGHTMGKLLDDSQEPLVPWMQSRFKVSSPKSLAQVAEIQAQRAVLEKEMLRIWTETDSNGRRRSKIDAIICPLAPHPGPEIEKYNAVGYTSSWVLLDYPAGTVPVRDVQEGDLDLSQPFEAQCISSWDERNRELWDEQKMNRKVYLGTPLSVQVVVPRLEEERLAAAMALVDRSLQNGGGKSPRPKL